MTEGERERDGTTLAKGAYAQSARIHERGGPLFKFSDVSNSSAQSTCCRRGERLWCQPPSRLSNWPHVLSIPHPFPPSLALHPSPFGSVPV